MKVVPLPFSLLKLIFPPCVSTRRLTTAKPKPCPLDFVVNSGVKSLLFTSSGMPSPVSSTLMQACLPLHFAFMFNDPPFAMA